MTEPRKKNHNIEAFGRGLGSLVRIGSIWHSRIYTRGREHYKTTGTPDLALARRVHKRLLDELALDRQGVRKFIAPVTQRVTVGELLTDLATDYEARGVRSAPQVASHVKPIREAFDHWRAADLTAGDIDHYIKERRAAGKSNATINRGLQILGQALKLGQERGKVAYAVKVKNLREADARQGFFEKAEVEAVIAALPEYLRDVVRFGYCTAWRRGEILTLTWSDIDLPGKLIRLPGERSKNGKPRSIPIEGELTAVMERRYQARLLERGVTDLVFHNDGKPIVDFRKAWATACEAAGVSGRLFHDLRRSAVRDMVRSGIPERVAMEISGHRTRSIFDRYNIVNEDDKRLAMRKRQAYTAAQSS